MNASFHVHRAIAELQVAQSILNRSEIEDPRISESIAALVAREKELIVARGMDERYWPETDAARFRCEAKRAARNANKEKS